MDRRAFLAGAAALLAAPLAAEAQQTGKVSRIGYLSLVSARCRGEWRWASARGRGCGGSATRATRRS